MKLSVRLKEKARWVRRETLKLHKLAPETRLASSLSDVEIFVALYYGGILRFDPKDIWSENRDRLIISKGHGAISLYPILADLDFFEKAELCRIGAKDSFLYVIPDATVPGIETTNGSLGHGLGVACGIAVALKQKQSKSKVFVILGDGELNEGSCWEAIMFAAYQKLNNLILIVDDNKMSMLDFQKNILGLSPLSEKFRAFNWQVATANGHDIGQLCRALKNFKKDKGTKPKVLIADTIKGKGVPALENDPLCHVRSLKLYEVDEILKK